MHTQDEKNKPIKSTPPYVACQLKAMSLLCDYLNQKGSYKVPSPGTPTNANEHYQQVQQQETKHFLTQLPATIYQTFGRLQAMRRHLAHNYILSVQERKHLLSYYHKAQPDYAVPKGALGAEWLSLSLESLLAERDALLAQRDAAQTLSAADNGRLQLITQRLKKLKPVLAKSSALELMEFGVGLPLNSIIHQDMLKKSTIEHLEKWHHRLPGDPISEAQRNTAIHALSSDISDDDFIVNFPTYLQQALIPPSSSGLVSWLTSLIKESKSPNDELRHKLMDFCTKMLIASRHIPLDQHDNNIPLLCTMLYRVLTNSDSVASWIQFRTCKFSELVKHLASLSVPPLKVYQVKDVYQDILITPDELIAQQEQRPKRSPLRINPQPQRVLIQQTGIETQLKQQKEQCLSLIAQYQQMQQHSEAQLSALEQDLNHSVEHTLAAEEQAGLIHFNLNQEKKALAASLMQITGLKIAVTTALAELQTQVTTTWKAVLALANEGPAEPIAAKAWFIAQQAKSRALLQRADLLALYSRADLAYYIEKTGLSREKAQQLHQLIHQSLLYGIQHQTVSKISEGLTNPERAVQALDLLSRAEIPGINEPAIMLLQHEDQIVLNQRQVTALRSLLKEQDKGFNETIEKIIMGGGKSKVILPILAARKAQGDNLVVLEVPQALLATNHVDLNRTSQRLFGKRAYRFEFHRDSDSSPQRLEQMYQLFTEIITTRSYLVTTGEAIQSLELKYIELLLSEEEHDETWRQQVYWCDKITKLFRHHADCIIDEVHQGLSIKKKLNYTSGEPKPLDLDLIKNATALFSFISQDIIEQAPSFDEQYDWDAFKNDLAFKLVNQTSSPLHHFAMQSVLRYGVEVKKELIAYLTNKTENMPPAVLKATAKEQSALAFFKQQITVRLPQTLVQKLDKHYGASRRPNLGALEQTLAIPYAASNIPNERNRFANELEAVNKTIQMMLIKGISKELLKERIEEWQSLAHQELFQTVSLKQMDETPTAQGFALLAQGLNLKLSQINTADAKQMAELHQRLQFNRSLIFDILRESTLKQIQQDKAIISSDNFNHVDQYRSVQGVSGTPPWNNTTYHQRLQYDKTSSLGTDGYIFELIRSKKPAIKGVEYHNAAQFVTTLLGRSQRPTHSRAIIDVKGAFTGVSNLTVAQQIARYIKENPVAYQTPLKHVVYFNEEQILCAIAINKPHQPIILGTSETSILNRLLDSTPEERFTYFDQIHTTGTDITQEGHTHALVLVDDKTSLQEFLQGSMRLRQLEADQSLELIVPERMGHLSLENLYQQFKSNDQTALFRDAPSAAKGQMKNHIRRHFLTLIQDIPSEDADKKALLIKHFRSFFEDSSSPDLFALYGALHKNQAIEKILGHYQDQLKQLWQSCLDDAAMIPYQNDIKAMNSALVQIITKAIPFCLSEYESTDDSFALEVEVQKEVQAEAEEEILALEECYDPKLNEARQYHWPSSSNYTTFFSTPGLKEQMTIGLNELCANNNNDEDAPIFSATLHASNNYAHTYHNHQNHYLGVFLKPVLLIWYHLESDGLHATIVTPQEAKQLEQQIKQLPASWIASTQDTVVAGKRPSNMLHDADYQSLREQVRFFNGEFTSLLNQDSPLLWIKEDPIQKFEFFSERLSAYRPDSLSGMRQLHSALTQGKTEGFAYISARPFEDLTHFNWLTTFPKTIPTQAAEYKKLAEAFVYLNKNWQHNTIRIDDLQQQFNLPIHSLTYIDGHLHHLMTLKKIMRGLQQFNLKTPFLHDLSETERLCIEQCLGISIELLEQHHHTSIVGKNKEQALAIISINALQILRLYPALTTYLNHFNPYFEACAQQADSKELLSALLPTANPSVTLIKNTWLCS